MGRKVAFSVEEVSLSGGYERLRRARASVCVVQSTFTWTASLPVERALNVCYPALTMISRVTALWIGASGTPGKCERLQPA